MDYREYIASREWAVKRAFALNRAGKMCQRCGYMFGLEVHHKHYRSLGSEKPEDLEVLCLDCHKVADIERKTETTRRVYAARVDGWASKKYGEDWESLADADRIEEEFDEWIERQDQ